MSKRILSLVLALVMVLGTFGSVFAASELTADIDDKAVVEAVERLAAFGIVNGMDDGKYHPELDITREQFAKLVVEATGLGSAAKAAAGSSMFKDVEASRWSAGYIAVASGQGVIKGYPDGTFGPAKNVTYAEAVTMLVRALGYKDEFLVGTWPGNYVAKAAELDITKGVTFAPSGFADRGSVAVMVNNTLDAEVIKVSTYEGALIKYTESDVILLTDKLGIDKVENIRLIATSRLDDALDADEIRLLVLKDDTMIDGKYYDEEDEVEVEIAENISIEGLVGMEITGYFDDDVMVYTEVETAESNYVRGIAYDDEGDGTILSLTTFKYYDYAKDAKVYINNEERTRDLKIEDNRSLELNNVLKEYDANYSYAYGTLILEKGKVTFADLSVFSIVSGIVQDVNTDKDIIQYINTWDAVEDEDLNLGDYDEYHVLALDGSDMELDEIEEGNSIYFYEDAQDDEIAYVLVDQRELVKGTLTDIKTGVASGSYPRGRIFVDGKAIALANDSTYSLDNMDSFQALNRFDNLKDKFDDVLDEKVTVYKDTKGRVSLLVSDVNETSDNYAVVIKSGKTGVRDEVKLWTAADDTITYEIDEFENGIKLTDIEDQDIIKYNINADGTIDILAIVYGSTVIEDGKDTVIAKPVDRITTKSVQVDGKYYFNQNASVYFDYSVYAGTNDDEDLDVLAWKDFEDTVVPAGVEVVLVTDGDSNDIEFMAFTKGYDKISTEDQYVGYLVKSVENKDNMTLTVMEYGNGEKTYTVSKTTDKNEFRTNIERPIVYTLSGDGIKLASVYGDDIKEVSGLVTKRSGNDLYVDGTRYVMENDVVIWEADGAIGKYDLTVDYPVIMVLKDGKVAVIAWDYNYDAAAAAKNAVKALFANYTTKAALAAGVDQAKITAAKTEVEKLDAGTTKTNLLADVAKAQELLNAANIIVGGKVTYIDATKITIDGKDYKLDQLTVYRPLSGAPVIGGASIVGALNVNDLVNIDNVVNGVVTSLTQLQSEASKLSDATTAVGALETAVTALDATTQTKNDTAVTALTAAKTAVAKLAAGADKTALQTRIATAETAINADQKTISTTAVGALETAVGALDATQAKNDAAVTALTAAKTAVAKMDASAQKTSLEARIALAEAAINADQDAIDEVAALAAVNAATTTLQMRKALVNNASVLDINVTGSFVGNENAVADEMLLGKSFANVGAVKAAFDAIVAGL